MSDVFRVVLLSGTTTRDGDCEHTHDVPAHKTVGKPGSRVCERRKKIWQRGGRRQTPVRIAVKTAACPPSVWRGGQLSGEEGGSSRKLDVMWGTSEKGRARRVYLWAPSVRGPSRCSSSANYDSRPHCRRGRRVPNL